MRLKTLRASKIRAPPLQYISANHVSILHLRYPLIRFGNNFRCNFRLSRKNVPYTFAWSFIENLSLNSIQRWPPGVSAHPYKQITLARTSIKSGRGIRRAVCIFQLGRYFLFFPCFTLISSFQHYNAVSWFFLITFTGFIICGSLLYNVSDQASLMCMLGRLWMVLVSLYGIANRCGSFGIYSTCSTLDHEKWESSFLPNDSTKELWNVSLFFSDHPGYFCPRYTKANLTLHWHNSQCSAKNARRKSSLLSSDSPLDHDRHELNIIFNRDSSLLWTSQVINIPPHRSAIFRCNKSRRVTNSFWVFLSAINITVQLQNISARN